MYSRSFIYDCLMSLIKYYQAKCEYSESVLAATISQPMALNSSTRSEKLMISVGHTNVLLFKVINM